MSGPALAGEKLEKTQVGFCAWYVCYTAFILRRANAVDFDALYRASGTCPHTYGLQVY